MPSMPDVRIQIRRHDKRRWLIFGEAVEGWTYRVYETLDEPLARGWVQGNRMQAEVAARRAARNLKTERPWINVALDPNTCTCHGGDR
jgi:hypothetical protein